MIKHNGSNQTRILIDGGGDIQLTRETILKSDNNSSFIFYKYL